MPKDRNRTVKNNFEFSSEFLKALPYPEKVSTENAKSSTSWVNQSYFGESVSSNKHNGDDIQLGRKLLSSSSSDNATSGISDVDIISFGKSSSSSISFNEDYDIEATRQVQNELERMERVLQGIEPIPSNYNKDEYEQWMKTFPQLSVIGSKVFIKRSSSSSSSANNYEEVIAVDSDLTRLIRNYDNDNATSASLNKIDNLKNAVIDQVFENVASKLLQKKPGKKACDKTIPENHKPGCKDLSNHKARNLNKEFGSFFRISPVLLQDSIDRSDIRQQSSQSVARSEKLASRWMHEEPVEYLSLPYISPSAKRTFKRKTPASSQMSSRTGRSNHVSLPPIVATGLASTNQYRSISATPRQTSKRTSALSVQVDSLIDKGKTRFELTSYLTTNGLNRKSSLLNRSGKM